MWFESYVKNNVPEFLSKVKEISTALGINPDYLMGVMYAESGLNPQPVNPVGGATGLIQFMPATATYLGTTTAALKAMTNVQQLDYVYKYLRTYAGKMHTFADVYFAIFFPVAIGKPDTYVLQTAAQSAKLIATQNPGFDLNKDGQITVGEFKQWLSDWQKKKGLMMP